MHKFDVEQSEKEREEGEAGNDVNKKRENIKEEWNIAGKKEKNKQKNKNKKPKEREITLKLRV